LGISVVVDAFFSDTQAYCKATFKPTANQLFTATNTFSFLFCIGYQALVDRSLAVSLTFIWNYPKALIYIFGIAGLQVIGQISIYYIVSNFKQHIFPLVATTRKVLSVIMSIFVFGHYINPNQWIAIGIVFFGMFYEFYEELKHEKHKDDRAEGKLTA
jgi:solute carrier family 35 (UDP-galactose transporter), member B1